MVSGEFANDVARIFDLGKVQSIKDLNPHVHRIDTSSGSFVATVEQLKQRPEERASSDRLLAQHKVWFDSGVPVAEPMAAAEGRFQVLINGLSLHVNRFIDGVPFDQACSSDRDFIQAAKSFGAGLAKLHGQSWRSTGDDKGPEPLIRQVSEIVTPTERSRFEPLFRRMVDGGPVRQYKAMIAGDIHDDNVLVEQGTNRVVFIDLDTETTRLRDPLNELSGVIDNLHVVSSGSPRAVKAFGAALYESYIGALEAEPAEKAEITKSLRYAQFEGLLDRFHSDDGQQGKAVRARIQDCMGVADQISFGQTLK